MRYAAASMSTPPRLSYLHPLSGLSAVVLVIGMLLGTGPIVPAASAQQIMPHRPLLPGFGGLCDGGPVVCTRIDSFAFHARADALLLTATDRRGLGFITPYGFSIGLFDRFEGGIHTHTAVWGQEPGPGESSTRWQQGPMRFLAKGLLWPWSKDPHQRFTALLAFEYEARLPRFDGPNQLGLLTDLGVLRGVVNWPLGLAEVGLSAGVLFDGHGRYGTAELGARLGLHLPFMPDTKVFIEGLARGFASRVRTDEPLPGTLDPANPIVPGGAIGVGIVTRPRRQVGFALVAHAGFGDVAPFFLTLRFADIAWGKGYPYPQSLVVDILREVGEYIAEQIRKLPTEAHETCILYDRAGQPLGTLGKRTPDGAYCEWEGHRFRFGEELYPDPERGRICLDAQAARCMEVAPSAPDASAGSLPPGASPAAMPVQQNVLRPESPTPEPGLPLDKAWLADLARRQGALGPLRRVPGHLDKNCELYEDGHRVTSVGHPSADGKHCVVDRLVRIHKGKMVHTEVRSERIQVGGTMYRDPQTGYVCTKANSGGTRDCPLVLDSAHNRPMTDAEQFGFGGARKLVQRATGAAHLIKVGAQVLTDPAKLSTLAEHTKEKAQHLADQAVLAARDPHRAKEAAADFIEGAASGAQQKLHDFKDLPRGQQIEKVGGVVLNGALDLATGAVVGGVLSPGERALEAVEDARKLAKAATKKARKEAVEETAEHTDEAAARKLLKQAAEAEAKETATSGAAPSLTDLSKAAGILDREGLTGAGRALQKHGNRPGSAFPVPRGTRGQLNQAGQHAADDILTSPGATMTRRHHARFGDVIEVRAPDGRGVRYDADGNFIGLLEP